VDVFREEDARGKGLKSLNAVDTDPEELEDVAIGLGPAATRFEVRLEVASLELIPTAPVSV
jgi:hypothetical protein